MRRGTRGPGSHPRARHPRHRLSTPGPAAITFRHHVSSETVSGGGDPRRGGPLHFHVAPDSFVPCLDQWPFKSAMTLGIE